jgi:uridine phosphorylase
VPGARRRTRLALRPVPRRLRPKTELAADAILVGDPGRSLLLAQELLVEPKMSNHARGLWGYTGRTPAGDELTIQATGMGGPSAAIVLADLAKLGVHRVVRVGTCVAIGGQAALGDLLVPPGALATGGSAISFGLAPESTVRPDRDLVGRLRRILGTGARGAMVASLDTAPAATDVPTEAVAVDMQTVAIFARARELTIAAAAVLVVSEAEDDALADEALDEAAKQAGRAAAEALSNPQVES